MNGNNSYDARAREWRGINPDGTPDEAMLRGCTATIVDAVQPRSARSCSGRPRGAR